MQRARGADAEQKAGGLEEQCWNVRGGRSNGQDAVRNADEGSQAGYGNFGLSLP